MKHWPLYAFLVFIIALFFIFYEDVDCRPAKIITIGGCNLRGYCGVLRRDDAGNEESAWMSFPVVGQRTVICVPKNKSGN